MRLTDTPLAAPRADLGRPLWWLLLLVAVALASRFQQFGNPIVHIDEEFYLLVGDRMLHGALPYVDIWDRKPIGLFLIYAGTRLLGGGGIIQYQLVATAFAVATAAVVARIASRTANACGARLAAILYLLWIPLLTGQGGQSPVFYNLPVALAALLVLRADEGDDAGVFARGIAAMAATGLAIQIKYTVVFEGGFFGLALLWIAWRRGWRPARLLAFAAALIATALLPTVVAALAYWRLGALDAWWFANLVSIFKRHQLSHSGLRDNALPLALYVAPLVIAAAHGAKLALREKRGFPQAFAASWLAVAALAIIVFGYYFDHYGLPLVPPACVAAAALLGRRRARPVAAFLLGGAAIACALLPTFNQHRRGTPAQFATLVSTIRPYAGGGLFVWDNLPMLYYVLDARLPGRFPFPTHLREANERGAIGIDQPAETRRILDARPAVVVIEKAKHFDPTKYDTPIVLDRLRRDYRCIAAVRVGRRPQLVYLRDDVAEVGAGRPGC